MTKTTCERMAKSFVERPTERLNPCLGIPLQERFLSENTQFLT